jgi:hypothetical protein
MIVLPTLTRALRKKEKKKEKKKVYMTNNLAIQTDAYLSKDGYAQSRLSEDHMERL